MYRFPTVGTRPIFEKACTNAADFAATTTSQQRAILAPAPAATPFTAATPLGHVSDLCHDGIIPLNEDPIHSAALGPDYPREILAGTECPSCSGKIDDPHFLTGGRFHPNVVAIQRHFMLRAFILAGRFNVIKAIPL